MAKKWGKGGQNVGTLDHCGMRMCAVSEEQQGMPALPLEVKTEIVRHLSQHDLVGLASVSRAFHGTALAAIYREVVVEVGERGPVERSAVGRGTVIRSAASWRRFVGVVRERRTRGELVRAVRILCLPVGVKRCESHYFVQEVLPLLTQLREFRYHIRADWIPDDVYAHLPQQIALIDMPLKPIVAARKQKFLIQELLCKTYVCKGALHQYLRDISACSWELRQNLTKLQLHRDGMSHSFTPRAVNVGQSLVVTQYMIDNNLPQPDGAIRDFAVIYGDLDTNFWDFLKDIGPLENLRELDISGADFRPSDAVTVRNNIALRHVETLSFTNVNEIQVLPEISYEVSDMRWLLDTHFRQGFLPSIAREFRNLRRLRLDYKEAVRDSTPEFLKELAGAGVRLVEIDLMIRWDKSRALTETWESTTERYVQGITAHRATLNKLSLLAKEELNYFELHKNIPAASLSKLARCENIQSLRIYGDSLQNCGGDLLEAFPRLKYLDLCGREAAGPPHLGLYPAREAKLDNWYRTIHIPVRLAERITPLRFVRINTCLFECPADGPVSPCPQGFDRWFERRTRVSMADD
ncbi:ACR067Cp [Eremothecium gossypii ATCC 10895]|uniref:ACR067Cp n=1 Tax=Eremothecium gossypii (strain ATCC 10895 / CBS 109.51 / FGSC 9923 / NRRL Y-1056) TaxID=284811 RepID=Q75C50_EREGS|nr:ACR067Cp [Eremothecium gossypii ATCC 10895]AAS51293.1 ACR067Cp [Eremothecium gossypii ATCC 10895]AEY95585.1 FACR067Cp [Eremothecium gossypii FDAG1]